MCVCVFDDCRKDDYGFCSKLDLLAKQGEPLPEAFQVSVATTSPLNVWIASGCISFRDIPKSW